MAGFMRLINAVRQAVPTECVNTDSLLCHLRDSMKYSQEGSRNDDVWDATRIELEGLPLSVLVPEYTEVLKRTLCVIKKCLPHVFIQNSTNLNSDDAAVDNGQAFIHLGLMQTYLLAPQGPVDPAEKQTILLQYAQQEVRCLPI